MRRPDLRGGTILNPGRGRRGGTIRGTVIDGTTIDLGNITDVLDVLVNVPRRNRVPLMMMPLRLEYRLVRSGRPKLSVTDNIADMTAKFELLSGLLPSRSRDSLHNRFVRDNNLAIAGRDLGNRGFATLFGDQPAALDLGAVKTLANDAFDRLAAGNLNVLENVPLSVLESHLLMRWYPDENFAEKGVAPATDEELAALSRLDADLGGRNWWDTSDTTVLDAWQAFVSQVGATRAVHLKRTAGQGGNPDWEARIGRIAALPARVALFTITGEAVAPLATGKPIPQNAPDKVGPVAYTGELLTAQDNGDDTWLTSFKAATEAGMGIRITAKTKVEQAKAADWIVAVGLHNPVGGSQEISTDEIEALLESRIANGEFGFLEQDSNTNNTPDQPTGYRRFEEDIPAFTDRASARERGAFGGKPTSADLLAEALGVDPTLMQKALDADDTSLEDARAMLRVIGPALIDDALDGSTVLDGVDENDFVTALAAGVVARGALPAVRFGSSAYGILPMGDVFTLDRGEQSDGSASFKVREFLTQYAKMGRFFLPPAADNSVPVLKPETPDSSAVFEEIMKSNRVSTRIDVATSNSDPDVAKAVTCPYVYGSKTSRRPLSYLARIRSEPIKSLPDPTAADLSWPLLYRLARMSLVRNTIFPIMDDKFEFSGSLGSLGKPEASIATTLAETNLMVGESSIEMLAETVRPGAFGVSDLVGIKIARVNAAFAAALRHLEAIAARPQGIAQLEVLMLEVLDLFQHRIDAFATGLAYLRLKQDREKGITGLNKGYYGFLGKLRPDANTGDSDGYILAPSTPQAVSSAVMRSAYLRHKADGAFEINLRSARVRRALKLLDILSKGHSLSEGLGMRGERLLHEARADAQILPLRVQFPIRDADGSESAGSRVFDGLAFVEAAVNPGNPAQARMKKQLADDVDALADIVMAEATHLRAIGASDAANAWLRVLSGGAPPGRPTFLRTQRSGQASAHKVSLMRKPARARIGAGPREIAEPTLAQIAADAMKGFSTAKIAVFATRTDGGGPGGRIEIRLQTDLKMRPIDLVIGGAAELQVRAKHFTLRKVTEDPQAFADLASVGGMAALTSGQSGLSIDLNAGGVDVGRFLEDGASIRSLFQGARSLTPGDLNAMAPAEHGELDEAEEIAMIEDAADTLAGRLTALDAKLAGEVQTGRDRLGAFVTRVTDAAARAIDPGASPADVSAAVAQAELARRSLLDALEPLAPYGEPGLLKVFSVQDALTDGAGVLTTAIEDALDRLADRRTAVAQAAALPRTGWTALSQATGVLDAQIEALRQATDGQALPVLPPYPRRLQKTRGKFRPRVALASALAEWVAVRKNTALLHSVAQMLSGTSAVPVSADATLDDTDDPTSAARTELRAPRANHFEHVFGPLADISGNGAVAGIVADEWTEVRPSDTQLAGLAINYDSPQSEPPHCILLGVPPNDNPDAWTEEKAAELTREAIAWMKVRALASHQRLTPAALLPNANQVAAKSSTTASRRIPDKKPLKAQISWAHGDGLIATVAAQTPSTQLGVTAAGIIEKLGFSRLKE